MPFCLSRWFQPSQNTYTVPSLAVRIVQPLAPLNTPHFPDAEPGMPAT